MTDHRLGSAFKELIFVSLEDWDEVWRRNQFVCAELSRRHSESQILFVGLPRNASHELRHGRVRSLLSRGTYRPAGFGNIIITHPWKLLPDSVGVGRRMNEAMFRWQVRRAARRLGIDQPLLWLNPHSAVHMVGRMGEAATVYDITDDWISMTQSPTLARRTEEQDAQLCQKADAVMVCSDRLFEMKREMAGDRLHLIPNGVNAKHYAEVTSAGSAADLSAACEGWARPVLGYTGTVHSDRVDVELVREVAGKWAGSVVLVGPNLLSPADRERLKLPNVHLVGPVKYVEIPRMMGAFDVCIVPHRMTAFTESLNPIKLWEYLAAGKPIVSTDVAGFRDFPKLVRLAKTADEFLAAAHAAVKEIASAEGTRLAQERQAIARENSWNQRVDEIERVIEWAIERRKSADARKTIVGRNKEASEAVHAG